MPLNPPKNQNSPSWSELTKLAAKKRLSTKCNSSHFHHISITMLWGIRIVILLKKIDLETLQISSHSDKIVMKMWSPLQAFFCTYHIFITFLTQFDGKEFCQKYHDYATVHLSWKRDEYVISWDNRMLFENSRFLSFLKKKPVYPVSKSSICFYLSWNSFTGFTET